MVVAPYFLGSSDTAEDMIRPIPFPAVMRATGFGKRAIWINALPSLVELGWNRGG